MRAIPTRVLCTPILFTLLILISPQTRSQDTRENAEFRLAVGLYNDGLLTQAEDQFRVFVDKFPGTSLGIEAAFYLGLIQMRTGKYAEARAAFQDFAIRYSDHPKAPDAWWQLGEVFALERNYAEAASAFARVKTFHPKSRRAAEALMQASSYFLKAGDADNARLVLNAVLVEYPQSAQATEATLAMADLLIETGDVDRAQRELQRVLASAVTKDDMRGRVTVALGRLAALLGNRDEAVTRYQEVLTKYAATAAVHEASIGLGDVHRQFRAFDLALDQYRRVSGNRSAPLPMRIRAYTGMAEAAREAGNDTDAARAYDSLLVLVPAQQLDPVILRAAADAARRAGNLPVAMHRYRILINDSLAAAVHREAIIGLARTAEAAAKPTDAAQAFQQYVSRFPDDDGAAEALLSVATITERDFGNGTRAAELYGAILDRYGVSRVADRAQCAQARVHERAGRFVAAADAYRQTARQYPASPLASVAQDRAEYLTRFRRGAADDALPALAGALAALASASGTDRGRVDLALGILHAEHLKDHESAYASFDAAVAAGLPERDAVRASYGRAIAAVRLAQTGKRDAADAERLLDEVIRGRDERFRLDAAMARYELRTVPRISPDAKEPGSEQHVQVGQGSFVASGVNAERVVEAASTLHRDLGLPQPDPRTVHVDLAAADALRELGRHAAADSLASIILQTLASVPEAQEALAVRGLSRASMKRLEDAIKDLRAYEAAVPNGRRAALAMMTLGQAYVRTGQYAEAAASFERLAERFPYSVLADSARIARIAAFSEAGMHPEALGAAAQALSRVQGNPFLDEEVAGAYLYAQAMAMAQAKNSTGARRALQAYLDRYGSGTRAADVLYALGQLFRDEGKLQLAAAYLQQAGARSRTPQARIDAADLLLESGRAADAAREYERLAAEVTGRVERSYVLSRIPVALWRAEKPAEAQKRADEFRAEFPDAQPVFDEFSIERGIAFFRQKQYAKAADEFDDVESSKTPAIAALALFWLGRCDEAQGKEQEAEKRWRAVIDRAPQSSAALEAHMAIARMATRAEKWDVAALSYRAVAESPMTRQEMLKQALNGLISCYDELKLYDAAAEMTKRFLDTWPNDASAFRKRVNLGVFFYQLRYFDMAVTHFQSLLAQATPDDQAELRYYIGESYFYKGDFTQAATEFLKVPYLVVGKTEIDWTASAYYMAGQSYEKLNRMKDALDMYERIVTTPGLDARFKAQARKEADRVKALMP